MNSNVKIRISFLIMAIVTMLSLSVFAQDNEIVGGSDPLVIDEFTILPCDEFLSRIDNFFIEITKHPDMIGVALISVDPAEKYKSVIAERTINIYVNFRKFPADRIKIVRTNSDEDIYFRFWGIDPDAALPDFGEIDTSFTFPKEMSKPFLLSSEDGDYCPEGNPRKIFVDFLNANPTARGKIVIHERSKGKAVKLEKQIFKDLVKTYGLSKDRLISLIAEPDSLSSSPTVEYWYLPQ